MLFVFTIKTQTASTQPYTHTIHCIKGNQQFCASLCKQSGDKVTKHWLTATRTLSKREHSQSIECRMSDSDRPANSAAIAEIGRISRTSWLAWQIIWEDIRDSVSPVTPNIDGRVVSLLSHRIDACANRYTVQPRIHQRANDNLTINFHHHILPNLSTKIKFTIAVPNSTEVSLKPGFHYPSWRAVLTARVDG